MVVRVHAAGFVPDELDWPGTWADRAGRDRTPSIPAHDVTVVVTEVALRNHRPGRPAGPRRRRARHRHWPCPLRRQDQARRHPGDDHGTARGRTRRLLHRRARPRPADRTRRACRLGPPPSPRRRRLPLAETRAAFEAKHKSVPARSSSKSDPQPPYRSYSSHNARACINASSSCSPAARYPCVERATPTPSLMGAGSRRPGRGRAFARSAATHRRGSRGLEHLTSQVMVVSGGPHWSWCCGKPIRAPGGAGSHRCGPAHPSSEDVLATAVQIGEARWVRRIVAHIGSAHSDVGAGADAGRPGAAPRRSGNWTWGREPGQAAALRSWQPGARCCGQVLTRRLAPVWDLRCWPMTRSPRWSGQDHRADERRPTRCALRRHAPPPHVNTLHTALKRSRRGVTAIRWPGNVRRTRPG